MYYCEFVRNTYGNFSFADVMLGDSIEEASKILSPYYNGDAEENPNSEIPRITGAIAPFDDKYMVGGSITLWGNPINCIELKAHFKNFPYNTFSCLEGMELSISDEDSSYMVLEEKPQWFKKELGTLFKKQRRTQMHNILCDYSSFVDLNTDGSTTIGIKVEIPKHNHNGESLTSVLASYKSVNKVVRSYRQELKTNRLLRKGDKNKIVL